MGTYLPMHFLMHYGHCRWKRLTQLHIWDIDNYILNFLLIQEDGLQHQMCICSWNIVSCWNLVLDLLREYLCPSQAIHDLLCGPEQPIRYFPEASLFMHDPRIPIVLFLRMQYSKLISSPSSALMLMITPHSETLQGNQDTAWLQQ